MTGVDEAGNRIAKYRSTRENTEILVHPSLGLTEELILAIAASAPWVKSYFYSLPD
jgi:hypothetical protein